MNMRILACAGCVAFAAYGIAYGMSLDEKYAALPLHARDAISYSLKRYVYEKRVYAGLAPRRKDLLEKEVREAGDHCEPLVYQFSKSTDVMGDEDTAEAGRKIVRYRLICLNAKLRYSGISICAAPVDTPAFCTAPE